MIFRELTVYAELKGEESIWVTNIETQTVWQSTFSHTTTGDQWANSKMAGTAADLFAKPTKTVVAASASDGESTVDDHSSSNDYNKDDDEEDGCGNIDDDESPLEKLYIAHERQPKEQNHEYDLRIQALHQKNVSSHPENHEEEVSRPLAWRPQQHDRGRQEPRAKSHADLLNPSPEELQAQQSGYREFEMQRNVDKTREEERYPEIKAARRVSRLQQLGDASSDIMRGNTEEDDFSEDFDSDKTKQESEDEVEEGPEEIVTEETKEEEGSEKVAGEDSDSDKTMQGSEKEEEQEPEAQVQEMVDEEEDSDEGSEEDSESGSESISDSDSGSDSDSDSGSEDSE